jgi:serine/threonine-protein kinase
LQLSTGNVVDRYEIEGVIGEGGMAVVYAVRHAQLGTRHALKVLTLPSAQIRQRLLQEGQVQARLRHPNIVAVTDVIDLDGAPGLIMERIEGPCLEDWLRAEEPSLAQLDSLARQILEGVRVAHEQQLVHRDLKPANILLEVGREGLVPKITDFGLAKILGTGGGGFAKTRTGSTMGTPHYMSPEQIRDSKGVGPRTDIFALGAILYEMLAGCRAFDGDDLLEIFNAVAQGKYTPLRDLVPEVPERMVNAIDRCLQVQPDDRFDSVDALLAAWGEGASSTVGVPFDAAALQRAASMTTEVSPSMSGSARSDDTWAPVSGIDAPVPVPEGSLVVASKPSSASSINIRGLALGLGGLGVASMGLFAAIALGSGATWYVLSGGEADHAVEAMTVEASVEDSEMDALEAAVLEAAADGEDAVMVAPTPPLVASRPAAVVPLDEGAEAVEGVTGEAALEGEDPAAAADGLVDAADVAAAEGEDLLVDAAGLEEAEAIGLGVEQPVEEVPVEELAVDDPRAALPSDLRSQSTAIRLSGLAMRETQQDATWIYDLVVRHDPHPEVRRKAWRGVIGRWRGGIGAPAEHEAIALWVLDNGTAEAQVTAVVVMARKGTDVTPLLAKLDDHRAAVRRAAVEAVAAMGKRLGQQDVARTALEARRDVETDGKTKSRIENALGRL